MRQVFLLFFLILSGGQTWAQTLTVRSGEHDDFTRFVVRLLPDMEWNISRAQRAVSLTVTPGNARFELSSVFDRIPRQRVTNATQAEPGSPLRFALGCDCVVDSFITRENWLVIDFKDGQEQAVQSHVPLLPVPRFKFVLGEGYRPIAPASRAPQQDETVALVDQDPLVLPLVPNPALAPPSFVNQPVLTLQPPQDAVQDYESSLLGQVERAVVQGLLDENDANKAEIDETSERKPEGASPVTPLRTQPQSNVKVATAIDRGLQQVAENLRAIVPDESRCILPSYVALNTWGDGRSFADQIGETRQGLIDDLTDVDPGAVIKLAKTYLHFGFGAEARHALESLPQIDETREVLESLARLIDDGVRLQDGPFSGQQDCDSDVALWAVLSEPDQIENANKPAVLRAVSRLPVDLRLHLAPIAGQLFSDAGDAETSEALLRTTGRAVPQQNPGARLAAASNAELRENFEQANDLRISVASDNSALTPEALVQLINSRYQRREAITPDIIDLIGAYAEELQRTDAAVPLQLAEVTALAMAGQFEDAVARLRDIVAQDTPEAAHEAEMRIVQMLTEIGSDMDFLRYALNLSEGKEESIPEDLGNALAKRLLELGFSQPAMRVLSTTNVQGSGAERRLLKAQAALVENLPHEAMVALLGIEGEQARALRARAMSQKQDFNQAVALLREAPDASELPRLQWMAEDWDIATLDDESPVYATVGTIAARMRQRNASIQSEETLENARDLLGASSQTRADVDQLLNELSIATTQTDQ